MPFHNFTPDIVRNPLVLSVFTQSFSESGDFPPPGSDFLDTDDSQHFITDGGDNLITD